MRANDLIAALGLNPDSKKKRSQVKSSLQLAVIDPSYGGTGNPKIRFYGESTVGSRQYPCMSSYAPVANDKVVVLLFSHSGLVLGKIGAGGTVPYTDIPWSSITNTPTTLAGYGITTDPNWQTPTYQNGYSDYSSPWGSVRYAKTLGGIVMIEGLCVPPSNPTSYQTIFTLPSGFRPGRELMFVTNSGESIITLNVDTAGVIQTRQTPSTEWVSLTLSFLAEQ